MSFAYERGVTCSPGAFSGFCYFRRASIPLAVIIWFGKRMLAQVLQKPETRMFYVFQDSGPLKLG